LRDRIRESDFRRDRLLARQVLVTVCYRSEGRKETDAERERERERERGKDNERERKLLLRSHRKRVIHTFIFAACLISRSHMHSRLG